MKNVRVYVLSSIFLTVILASTVAVFRAQAPTSAQWQGYVKPGFPDYAPSGMPDFDEKQDSWGPGGTYTWCGPVAAANSLWWLDSEYESIVFANPVPPPTISDHFPLVTNYSSWDDHDPNNVMALVPNLAILMDTDGMQTHDGHTGTRWQDLENGTKYYIAQQGLTKYFDVSHLEFPDFGWLSIEILQCHDVVLFLEFYKNTGTSWTPLTSIPSLESGHFVTSAGMNTTTSELLISDPYQDAYENGKAPGRSPVAHAYPHGSAVHNDAQNVSQDAYLTAPYPFTPPPPPPPGYPPVALELKGYLQTMGFDATWHTFIRAAVVTSPKPVSEWPGYVKPSFPDYAPSCMPDFDQKQDAWGPGQGTYTWCVPVAVADSLWWLDSEYESMSFSNPVPPPTISDHFPLVTNFTNGIDDHDPSNVAGLVVTLAHLMDTDGQVSGDHHIGTRLTDVQKGIQQYLALKGVANLFEVHNQSFPDFIWMDSETEKCQDVELFLEIWQWTGSSWTNTTIPDYNLELGHCVTCAGVNSTTSQFLICDPYQDAYENGTAPGRSPVIHAYPHNSAVHNDTQYVSQDAYNATPYVFGPQAPPGYPQTVWELQGYLQTMPLFDPSYHAFIRAAIATSPLPNLAIVGVTAAPAMVCQTYGCDIGVNVANRGNSAATFNVTLYANMTLTANTTTVYTFTNVTLNSGHSILLFHMWDTTGFALGDYAISAYVTPVPGEIAVADNTFVDSTVQIIQWMSGGGGRIPYMD